MIRGDYWFLISISSLPFFLLIESVLFSRGIAAPNQGSLSQSPWQLVTAKRRSVGQSYVSRSVMCNFWNIHLKGYGLTPLSLLLFC